MLYFGNVLSDIYKWKSGASGIFYGAILLIIVILMELLLSRRTDKIEDILYPSKAMTERRFRSTLLCDVLAFALTAVCAVLYKELFPFMLLFSIAAILDIIYWTLNLTREKDLVSILDWELRFQMLVDVAGLVNSIYYIFVKGLYGEIWTWLMLVVFIMDIIRQKIFGLKRNSKY